MGPEPAHTVGKPAQALADRYLRAAIEAARGDGAAALPPVRVMAKRAGVSVPTLRRALERYTRDGTLVAVGGKGIFLGDTAIGAATEPKLTLRCERIAHCLEGDILGGRYSTAQRLPSMKELLARFGADYRTMRKALSILAARGLVSADRPYPILQGMGPSVTAGATLAFLARGQALAERFGRDVLNRIAAVEDWCAAHGTSMVPLFYYFAEGSRLTVNGADAEPFPLSLLRGVDLGCLVHTSGLHAVGLPDLMDSLHRANLPVAVVDPDEMVEPSMLPRRNRRIRVFIPTSQRDAGRAVGRYLARCGCRQVVYVSPFHGDTWSRERLAGIAEACRNGGRPIALEVCTMPHPRSVGAETGRFTQSRVDSMRNRMIRGGLDESDPADRLFANTVRTMMPAFGEYLDEEVLRLSCDALFERLPRFSPEAALVCASDRVARCYHRHVVSHKPSGPAPARIVGFDNRFPATYYRFSSYSFNEQALLSSAFSFILHPDAWRDRGPFVRLDGRLVVRE